MFWSPVDNGDGSVRCDLCPRHCVIKVGKRGACRSRYNHDGILYASNYAKAVSLSIDPIEKKPLYHYYPGAQILSTGPNSCNLRCDFCQNYSVSQVECETIDLGLNRLRQIFESEAGLPKRLAVTYTEPMTWYEYIIDLAAAMPELKIVLITNGYIESEPLKQLLPLINAMNIDLKSIKDEFYQTYCGGSLSPVIDTINLAESFDVHIEVTNLLIPGMNDSRDEVTELAKAIAAINWEIPLHFSAYHPAYRCKVPATSSETVLEARKIARDYLRWVYAGNIAPGRHCDTYCDKCGELMISRRYGDVLNLIPEAENAVCPNCLEPVWGRFETI